MANINFKNAKGSLYKDFENMSQEEFDKLSAVEKAILMPHIQAMEKAKQAEQDKIMAEQEREREEQEKAKEEQEKARIKAEKKEKRQQFVLKGIRKGKEFIEYGHGKGKGAIEFFKTNFSKENIKKIAKNFGRSALEKLKPIGRFASEKFKNFTKGAAELKDKAGSKINEVKDNIIEVKDSIKDKIEETKDNVKQGISDVKESVTDKINEVKADYTFGIEQEQLKRELGQYMKDSKNDIPDFSYADGEKGKIAAFQLSPEKEVDGKKQPAVNIIKRNIDGKDTFCKVEGPMLEFREVSGDKKLSEFLFKKMEQYETNRESAVKVNTLGVDGRSGNYESKMESQKLDTKDVGIATKAKEGIKAGAKTVFDLMKGNKSEVLEK